MAGNQTPQRILLVRPSALGDACRSVPVLVSLAKAWPEATLGWVIQEGFEDVIRCHPDLDEIVVFPRKALAKWATRPWVLGRSIKWMHSLRRGHWDLVVDCQGLVRSGLMSFASGARLRVGDRGAREGAWLAYNHRVKTESHTHTVDRMLNLLEPLGVEQVPDMQLYTPRECVERWNQMRRERAINTPYLAFAPTTRWPSKAWPDDHWVQFVKSLNHHVIPSVVLVGSDSERPKVALLAKRLRDETGIDVHDLAGQTSIGELMAVIESARLTVANDTAALHMAVGLGGRCVGLYGPTDPAEVGPYRCDDRVVYAPPPSPVNYRDSRLGDRIMRSVSVESVLEMTRRVLDETADDQLGTTDGGGAAA
ncbi:MAG: glycosyltransferase family 9 protein [Planctomycetota bacterium]|nr:glycosyltransferase family 9 protein [Planctomycetota bacterium]